MRTGLILLALGAAFFTGAQAGEKWAFLVAGTGGWWNYGSQAGVFHAYQMLTSQGVNPDNIIVMASDDIADSSWNPYPGQVFNEPDGPDVYAGVKIDYSGSDVSPDNFLAVLSGDKDKVQGGNGRVIEAQDEDKVFVYFDDHGGSGVICFDWDEVTKKELNAAIKALQAKAKIKFLIHIDACFAGSMFVNDLATDTQAHALTAADPNEYAYFAFCDTDVGACLGSYFTYSWISESEKNNLTTWNVNDMYKAAKAYVDVSHVSEYGDPVILEEPVGCFFGTEKPAHQQRESADPRNFASWSRLDAPLRTVEARLDKETEPAKRAELQNELSEMRAKRAYLDAHTAQLVERIARTPVEAKRIAGSRPTAITRDDCHHDVVKAYSRQCFNVGANKYAITAVTHLTAACELGVPTARILNAIRQQCSSAAAFQNIL